MIRKSDPRIYGQIARNLDWRGCALCIKLSVENLGIGALTYYELSTEERLAVGIQDNLVRLSLCD